MPEICLSKERESYRYEFFRHEEDRYELYLFSKKTAEYMKSEEINNLVLVDRSARPFYVGIFEYLRFFYSKDNLPKVYFINPKGFDDNRIDIHIEDIFGGDLLFILNNLRDKEDILNEFVTTFRRLVSQNQQPVLIFDSCIHTGETLFPVKEIFKRAGFKDIRIGSVSKADNKSIIKTDFHIINKDASMLCYPFGVERKSLVTHSNNILAEAVGDSFCTKKLIQLRKEISHIVKMYSKKDKLLRRV